jgi:hypothetical protein
VLVRTKSGRSYLRYLLDWDGLFEDLSANIEFLIFATQQNTVLQCERVILSKFVIFVYEIVKENHQILLRKKTFSMISVGMLTLLNCETPPFQMKDLEGIDRVECGEDECKCSEFKPDDSGLKCRRSGCPHDAADHVRAQISAGSLKMDVWVMECLCCLFGCRL